MKSLKLHTGNTIDIYSANTETALELPYVEEGTPAGFPSPALDFVDQSIDINKHLIKNPSATFYGRVKEDSLQNAGIHNGDLLVIDRSLESINGKIADCFIDGKFTAKCIKIEETVIWLIAENENYEAKK